ncbi:uncharacterized protein [Argopecten irradians]|uniref:uncharacterized protein n=1 Tax=Argopecten irradians TaxID=31199 RepID=UPI003724893F
MFRLSIIIFVLIGMCSCQRQAVYSSTLSRTPVSNQMLQTQYPYYFGNQATWSQFGASQTQSQNDKDNDDDKSSWKNLFSKYMPNKKKEKETPKRKTIYQEVELKTKPPHYRMRSVGRTIVEQYIQQFMPKWTACITLTTNVVNNLFNPTSIVATTFVNEGVDNLCANTLLYIVLKFLGDILDHYFEKMGLGREWDGPE